MDFILLVFLIALLIGLSKGGFGGPVPVSLITPLLSQIMPTSQAVGLVLPLLIIGDWIALRIYWRQWDIRYIKQMLPFAVIGVILGGALLLLLADSKQDLLLRRILGAFTLVFVLYKVGSDSLKNVKYEPRNWHGYVAGWASGFGSALANVGAPPYTAYMLLQDVSPTIFMGTTTLFFAIVNLLKLPITLLSSNVLNLHLLASIIWVVPVIPVGSWLGRRFVQRVNPKIFERMMLVLLFGMSIYMLFAPGK
ncbi:MAG: sulfite exporter TauE/SafE family protein [Chloroflexota bacterium]